MNSSAPKKQRVAAACPCDSLSASVICYLLRFLICSDLFVLDQVSHFFRDFLKSEQAPVLALWRFQAQVSLPRAMVPLPSLNPPTHGPIYGWGQFCRRVDALAAALATFDVRRIRLIFREHRIYQCSHCRFFFGTKNPRRPGSKCLQCYQLSAPLMLL